MSSNSVRTTTRKQRLHQLLAQPPPVCTSRQYECEHDTIHWKLQKIVDTPLKNVRQIWLMNLLSEALTQLHDLDEPASTPTNSRKDDNRRWTEIMVRRTIAEQMWADAGESITFHDCYDALREGRSRAAQVRLFHQVRTCWTDVTGTGLGSEFRIASPA